MSRGKHNQHSRRSYYVPGTVPKHLVSSISFHFCNTLVLASIIPPWSRLTGLTHRVSSLLAQRHNTRK